MGGKRSPKTAPEAGAVTAPAEQRAEAGCEVVPSKKPRTSDEDRLVSADLGGVSPKEPAPADFPHTGSYTYIREAMPRVASLVPPKCR